MAEKLMVELQDSNGNIFYAQTSAAAVFCADGKTVQEKIGTVKGRIATKDNLKLVTEANYLAEAKAVKDLFDELNSKSAQTVTQTINGLSCKFYFTKVGKTVQCAIDAVGTLSSSNAGVNGVIPEAYRPIYVTRLVAKNISGSSEYGTTQYRIDKEGRVEIASGELRNAERYVTGCWLTN